MPIRVYPHEYEEELGARNRSLKRCWTELSAAVNSHNGISIDRPCSARTPERGR